MLNLADLKIGMVLKTPSQNFGHPFVPNSIIQIIYLNKSSFGEINDTANYIYLDLGMRSFNYIINFRDCVLIENHPLAYVVCQNCLEFCHQKCLHWV